LLTVAAIIYFVAYAAGATIAYMSAFHKDFGPVYAAVAMVALIRLIDVLMKRRDKPDGDEQRPAKT
jgi:hypothetical protein